MEQQIKVLRKKLDNRIFRRNILKTSKKKSMQKMADGELNPDDEVTKFEQDMLEHWNELWKVPQVAEDLKDVEEEKHKSKINELKNQFCEYLINSEGYTAGYNYADKNRHKFVNKFKFKK